MRWTVIEHAGRPVASGPSALLAAPGGTIGRSPDNHLVLPDEQRQISRLQATVRFDGNGIAVLRNMSAVLPIGVNGRTLGHDEESQVADGDRVSIGSYVLEATSSQRPPVAVAPPAAPAPAAAPGPVPAPPAFAPAAPVVPFAAGVSIDPLASAASAISADPSASGASSDVFADLFGAGALPIGDPKTAAVPAATALREPPRDAVPFHAPVPVPVPAPASASASASASVMAAPAPVVPAPAPPPFAPAPAPVVQKSALSTPFELFAPSAPAAASLASHGSPSLPSAADWDAILADAPRRSSNESALPMPDPMAHEPFELPSQARRNPVDPLAELNPDREGHIADMALKRGVDPLALFAADSDTPSPLADPRPSLLAHEQPLGEVHPALELMARPPAMQGYSHSNHAPEMSAQFRPPLPVASPVAPVRPVAAAPSKREEALAPSPPSVAAPVVAPPRVAVAVPAPAPVLIPEPEPAPAPAPVPVPVPVSAPASASSPSPLSDELFKAFLEGAGVPDLASSQQPLDAEAMRRIGRLLRTFTDGTIELLSSRAMLKREVRAEITMIVDEENNPFKILPNGRAVLMQMFGARMPGFLTPEAAVHDALGDLQSHQLGMVAGMRAALLTLLQRFDPAALSRDTPHDGGIGEKWLPGGREARLWRQLELLHAQTTEAVEDDFQAVFGRAFQQAYDQEMERLKEARRA